MTRSRFREHWLPYGLFAAHLGALVFGLVGILVMLPNPELWVNDANAVKVFDFSMKYAGAIHIILGAAVMLVAGVLILGWWKTLVFAGLSGALSLVSELIGTGTGWPFGNYEYTSFLGYKVLGRVPYSIPLSWFYMGLASYLLGIVLAERLRLPRQPVWGVVLGVWFLVVWDLVLDPAMAHESLSIQFWVWDERGAYFGMPVKNFIGWAFTGVVFMALSRLVWRSDPKPTLRSMHIPLAIYLVNLVFAMVLSGGVGLWEPIIIALVLGGVPAVFAVLPRLPEPAARPVRWAQDA